MAKVIIDIDELRDYLEMFSIIGNSTYSEEEKIEDIMQFIEENSTELTV